MNYDPNAPKRAKCEKCKYYVKGLGIYKGKKLDPSRRYCFGGGKRRRFRAHDAKIYRPRWCPEEKSMRIFTSKTSNTYYQEGFMLVAECRNAEVPDAYRLYRSIITYSYYNSNEYTLKMDGAIIVDLVKKLTGFKLHSGDVIEIDDGIKPYYFQYYTVDSIRMVTEKAVEAVNRGTNG